MYVCCVCVCLWTVQVSHLEEEVTSLKTKMAGLRNQCQSLKQELAVTQKVGCEEGRVEGRGEE